MKIARFAATSLAAGILALAVPAALAQASTWKSDPAHSEVDFSIRHMSISNVHGRFGKVDATVVYDDQDLSKSSVNATIDVTGIDTGNTNRDNDIKGEKYFDVAKYPTATFTSTSVAKGGSGLQVSGNLTLKGVTKPVVLDVDGPTGPAQGMDHKMHAGFEATTTVKRTDFGIGAGMPATVLGDDVKITIELDVARQ